MEANVFMSFQPLKTRPNDFEHILDILNTKDYKCTDLTENELAKVHARYLAGGRANAKDERLFRFEFPESPGALQRFLASLDVSWNISLFHYRNHGDDFGRVLVGIQIPQADEEKRVQAILSKLGYRFTEETGNEIYKNFLM